MTKCAICGKKKGTFAFPELLRSLGIYGKNAHPSCVVNEQNKQSKKAKRQALMVRRK